MSRLDPSRDERASRREFMKQTGQMAGVSALAGTAIPSVQTSSDHAVRFALVGCGGRGSGAAVNALSVKHGPMRLVAMADVFENRLSSSYQQLKDRSQLVDVPRTGGFLGSMLIARQWIALRPAMW